MPALLLLRRVAREPLLHFLVLGGLAFGVYRGVHRSGPGQLAALRIAPEEIAQLEHEYAAESGHAPTPEEKAVLREQVLDDEVLYREALALGLDQGDVIVRRRLIQKMSFLAEDLGPAAEPTDAELQAFLTAHLADYVEPERVSFTHIFLSRDRRGGRTDDDARRMLAALRRDPHAAVSGDPFMGGEQFVAASPSDVGRHFGPEFVAALASLEPGGFGGPVTSQYGLHLVRIDHRMASRVPGLDELRGRLREELVAARRDEARQRSIQRLRTRYGVPSSGPVLPLMPPALTAEELRR